MLIEHGECRSLISWLMSQEKVLSLWIDEVANTPDADQDLVAALERHHAWLSEWIGDVAKRVAA